MDPAYIEILELGRKNAPFYKKMLATWRRHPPKNLDARMALAQEKAFETIDCLNCGNCCRDLGPRIHPRDIGPLAKTLHLKERDFEFQYLRTDEEGHMVFQSPRCPFIQDDNHCFVYHDRPRACHDYPHLDQRNQSGRASLLFADAAICPVVVLALEEFWQEAKAKIKDIE